MHPAINTSHIWPELTVARNHRGSRKEWWEGQGAHVAAWRSTLRVRPADGCRHGRSRRPTPSTSLLARSRAAASGAWHRPWSTRAKRSVSVLHAWRRASALRPGTANSAARVCRAVQASRRAFFRTLLVVTCAARFAAAPRLATGLARACARFGAMIGVRPRAAAGTEALEPSGGEDTLHRDRAPLRRSEVITYFSLWGTATQWRTTRAECTMFSQIWEGESYP